MQLSALTAGKAFIGPVEAAAENLYYKGVCCFDYWLPIFKPDMPVMEVRDELSITLIYDEV